VRLLEAQGDELPEPDVLRLALQQATAALGALGGFVHLRRRVVGSDELRLVTASGLPDTITHAWVSLPEDDDLPPVRAARDGETHWAAGDRAGIGATGMIAVPLPGGVTGRWARSRCCAFWRAGHPPPLIGSPDGTAQVPDIPANPALGAAEPPAGSTGATGATWTPRAVWWWSAG
jgi:hypothetical protein